MLTQFVWFDVKKANNKDWKYLINNKWKCWQPFDIVRKKEIDKEILVKTWPEQDTNTVFWK